MDLKTVREEAIEATARAFWDRNGFVPDQDSDEWEEEYRRQFEQVRKRHATGQPAPLKSNAVESDAAKSSSATSTRAKSTAAISAGGTAPRADEAGWAVLTGAPTQIRWAAAVRADRLAEIRNPGIRDWLAKTWTKAKSWIDTGDWPTPIFLQRIEPHYAEYRREMDERARALAAEAQAKAAAAEALRREVEAAGITVEGLIELIDVCERLPSAPIKDKLAELHFEGRHLRVFETADPLALMVLEKTETGRSEYGIERDEGLVADLKLFARAAERP